MIEIIFLIVIAIYCYNLVHDKWTIIKIKKEARAKEAELLKKRAFSASNAERVWAEYGRSSAPKRK